METSLMRTLKSALPKSVRAAINSWSSGSWYTPVGWVRFGSLRRRSPLSRQFGYDRGLPVDRYYIERFLASRSEDIRGRVLEFGDATYTRRFGGDRVTSSDVIFPTTGNPHATIVADLASDDPIPEGVFDCIICTQTLHLFFDPTAAVRKLCRAIRPGGVLLATLPGMSQISDASWRSNWYWGFTGYSAERIFSEVFGPGAADVEVEGNVLAATAYLYGLAAKELRRKELDHRDPDYHLVIGVRARKADVPGPSSGG